MATAKLYFPSSGYDYKLKSGNYRLEFRYENASTLNVDSDCEIIRIGDIKYFLGADYENPTYRYSYLDVEIENISDFFESSDFTNGSGKLFAEIKKSGSLWFSGYIPFRNLQRLNYYRDSSGNIKYRTIKIRIYDALYYYKDNNLTLNDVSFTDGDSLKDTLDTIVGDVHTGTITYDSKTMISETIAGTTYTFSDIDISDTDTSYLISDLLANISCRLGMLIFNYNGVYYFKFRDTSGGVDMSGFDILDVKKTMLEKVIKYIKVSGTKDWDIPTYSVLSDYTNEAEYGDDAVIDDYKLLVTDNKQFLFRLGTTWSGAAAYPSSQQAPTSYGAVGLTPVYSYYKNTALNYATNDAETGQCFEYGSHPTYKALPIQDVNTSDTIYVPYGYYAGENGYILRNNTTQTIPYFVYKILKLVDFLASELNTLYLAGSFKDRLNIKYNDTDKISYFYNRIYIDSEYRYIDEITLNLAQNNTRILTI